ncbi:MAG: glycosyltransferase [Alphaproteobacteria bacterium]|nr:glycosyltransferase [Alphaproteobacteria bacterium]
MRKSGFAVLVVILLVNLGVWWWMNLPHTDVPWSGVIKGVSFSPYQKDDNPITGELPTEREIERDLAILAGKVASVRTYTALEGMDVVPPLARQYGMRVMAGAWLDGRLPKNEAELRSLIAMARDNKNIDRLIVGNEALHRGDVTAQQLVRYLRRVKEKVRQPISTAEPWYVWLKYPELAREVDFIAVHILPYWEGVPAEESVPYLLMRYRELRAAFPDKHVTITEVGWPSAGKARKWAEPSQINQAMVLRRFLDVATRENIDYNIIEAFDQPWKKEIEWSVGSHWGMLDVDRHPKFSMIGPIIEFAEWPLQAAAATVLAMVPLGFLLWRWNHLRWPGKLFFAVLVQVAASMVIWVGSVPMLRDFGPSAELLYSVLLPAQMVLVAVVLINGWELAELTWSHRMRRRFLPFTADSIHAYPKVSLHLPICNEPPHMVKLTLDSLAQLDYPNFEVVVLDNNTRDPEVWKPVKEHCERLGANFRFFTLGKWPGYKAGALNYGLSVTAPDAEVVGVIDADYVVEKDWLRSLVPYFENPKVGWVQAPQDHREWDDHPFKEMINWEYAGFFHIGMVTRNESNASIQHGTMTLVRKEALVGTGNWGEWTICEDAELGLRLLENGYESVYVNHSFGRGLTPDTFLAYKKQRFRWAFGAMQIMRGHSKELNPFRHTKLTPAQKYHFLSGWLPWIADAFYLLFTILSLVWSAGLVAHELFKAVPEAQFITKWFDFPLAIFVLPTIGVFAAKLVHHIFLYSSKVRCNWRQRIGSAVAGMGLTYSIALAVWQGFYKKHTPFFRTPKCEDKAALSTGLMMARDECLLMLAQWGAAFAVLSAAEPADPAARLWALVLFVQSMPYAAAVATSLVSILPSASERRAKKLAATTVPAEAAE